MTEQFHGHTVRVERLIVGGVGYELLAPQHGEALLDDPEVIERFERDEYMPYWAMLWPAAVLLAHEVARWPAIPPGAPVSTVVEIGCGLGLVGLVAARLGYRVILSDHDADALAFARENACRNSLPTPETRRIDWRQGCVDLRADRILAADVLYEARNLRPVAEFIRAHLTTTGIAYVCDPNRLTADSFPQTARSHGLRVSVQPVEGSAAPGDRLLRGRVFRLSRAP